MADIRVTVLPLLVDIDPANDPLLIEDVSANATKKTTPNLLKTSMSLSNVNNTTDLNKPISTATQTALDLKENTIVATTSADYYSGSKAFLPLNKAAVNLANVDNTTDLNKPVSTATQTALNLKQNAITLTTTGSSGAATLVGSTLNIPQYSGGGASGVSQIVAGTNVTISPVGGTGVVTINATGGSAGSGTVTNVSALTLGATGTDLSSTVANGTTTPVITLNVPTASVTNRGALSSTDWSTFNSKQGAITLTTTGSSGAATFAGNTLNIPQYAGAIPDGDKGDIVVSAGGTVWTIENSSVTNNKVASGIDAVKLADGSVDNAEFQTLNGVTSAIQTQINNQIFSSDFTIALAGGKTFGKFVNGNVVPATGKTAREVILLAAQEALAPTVSLASPTSIQFNQTAISNVLNFSYVINSLGASVASVLLEFRRNNTGAFTALTTNTALTTFTHTLTDTNFNTQPFNYRYTVTDTSGGTLTVLLNITPAAYAAPSISIGAGATTRYLGDIASTISGNVSRNSALVNISSYSIEVSVNGGAYSQIDTNTLAATGGAYSFAHNNAALVDSTSLAYRTKVVDAFTTTTSAVVTISLVYRNALGFNSGETITIAQLEAFGNISLTNSRARTFTGITASATDYTYYVYAASSGDLTNVILDGTTPILGAFTKLTDLTGTNLNGASVTYRVYRSNAKGAFTSNSIQFI